MTRGHPGRESLPSDIAVQASLGVMAEKNGFRGLAQLRTFLFGLLETELDNRVSGKPARAVGSLIAGAAGGPVTQQPGMGGRAVSSRPGGLAPRLLLLHGASQRGRFSRGITPSNRLSPGPQVSQRAPSNRPGGRKRTFFTGSGMTSCRAVECCRGRGGRWELEVDF